MIGESLNKLLRSGVGIINTSKNGTFDIMMEGEGNQDDHISGEKVICDESEFFSSMTNEN